MSLHPLLPEMLVGKGLPDEQLMYQMAEQDIDYAKFESVSKGVKHDSIIPFFNANGSVEPGLKLEDYRPEHLVTSYLKYQLSTDHNKTENGLGAQQRVMFYDVKYQKEVQNNPELLARLEEQEKRYLESINNIMDYQRAKLLNEFGMKEVGFAQSKELIIEMSSFAAAINSVLKHFPSNMMECKV